MIDRLGEPGRLRLPPPDRARSRPHGTTPQGNRPVTAPAFLDVLEDLIDTRGSSGSRRRQHLGCVSPRRGRRSGPIARPPCTPRRSPDSGTPTPPSTGASRATTANRSRPRSCDDVPDREREAALAIPARFLGQVHPHFREIQQMLAITVADEARHIDVPPGGPRTAAARSPCRRWAAAPPCRPSSTNRTTPQPSSCSRSWARARSSHCSPSSQSTLPTR